MIPEKELCLLMASSKRDANGDMVLDLDAATDEIIKIAKEYYWAPFNVVDGDLYQL